MKPTFFILIFITFIDFMGIGLIYPIFSELFFDKSLSFLVHETTAQMRGFYLGLLFALMPLTQLFSSPVWGTISDSRGRKKPLQISLAATILGHLISVFGITLVSVPLLLLSRIVLGIGGGNISVVQASIADMSSDEQKPKHFGLYAMAIGAGFTLGPFIGGMLSSYSYILPFIFALALTSLNLLLALVLLKETHHTWIKKKLSFLSGIQNLKKALNAKHLSLIFACAFLTGFAWTYFLDFAPVYLIKQFDFSSNSIGLFYGAIGLVYSLSAGLFIRPFLSRFKPQTLFLCGSLLAGLALFTTPFYTSIYPFIPFIIFFGYCSAFIAPTSTALVSQNAPNAIQGEALGILGSVNTASYGLSALLAGTFIGLNPSICMWVSGGLFAFAALLLYAFYK